MIGKTTLYYSQVNQVSVLSRLELGLLSAISYEEVSDFRRPF